MNMKVYLFKKLLYRFTNKRGKLMQLQVQYFSEKGMKIGSNFRVMSNFEVSEPYLVEIGDEVTISTNVSLITHDNSISRFIEDGTDTFGKIKIGNRCFIGSNAIILPGVELGDNTVVGSGSVVTKSFKDGNVVIGGNPSKRLKDIDDYVKTSQSLALNMRGLNPTEKKKLILNNSDKFISK